MVIYFRTKEPDGEQNAFIVNFSDNSDLRRGFTASLRDVRDRDIQEEQQKAMNMFFEGNGVSISLPTGFGKSLIHYAAPVIDRLSSPKKPVAIFIVPPFKALIEDQVHYLHVLGPR